VAPTDRDQAFPWPLGSDWCWDSGRGQPGSKWKECHEFYWCFCSRWSWITVTIHT